MKLLEELQAYRWCSNELYHAEEKDIVLPRRHIFDVWESIADKDQLLVASAGTLVIDAIKHLNADPERDHLVEALELNEFICYMYPSMRPHNKSLLFHVVSDLLGLLLYGIPKKRLSGIESLEVIDYSGRNTFYPVVRVWQRLKTRIGATNTLKEDIVEGFINKIRVEMYVVNHYPFVDDIFFSSRKQIEKWLPALSGFYERTASEILEAYEKWWGLWLCKEEKEKILESMVERLFVQAKRDFGVDINKEKVIASIMNDDEANKKESERFSRWYRESVDLLFAM
jgi:hypothetical protein